MIYKDSPWGTRSGKDLLKKKVFGMRWFTENNCWQKLTASLLRLLLRYDTRWKYWTCCQKTDGYHTRSETKSVSHYLNNSVYCGTRVYRTNSRCFDVSIWINFKLKHFASGTDLPASIRWYQLTPWPMIFCLSDLCQVGRSLPFKNRRNNDKKIKQTEERMKLVTAVQSLGTSSLWWETLVKKVGFEPRMKEKVMDCISFMDCKWQWWTLTGMSEKR